MAQTSFRDLQRQLIDIGGSTDDLSPLVSKLDEDFRADRRAQFLSGKGWAPVSAQYAARKAHQGRGHRVGVLSGGLERALTQTGGHHIARQTRDKSIILGEAGYTARTGRPIPVAFLFGGKHKNGQPRRRLDKLTPAVRRRWLGWVQDHLVGGST